MSVRRITFVSSHLLLHVFQHGLVTQEQACTTLPHALDASCATHYQPPQERVTCDDLHHVVHAFFPGATYAEEEAPSLLQKMQEAAPDLFEPIAELCASKALVMDADLHAALGRRVAVEKAAICAQGCEWKDYAAEVLAL